MRAEKQLLLDEIIKHMKSSSGMIVTSYQSITANLSWDLRSKLHEIDSLFEVVKKRIFLKASDQLGMQANLEQLQGHVGVFFAKENTLAAIKHIFAFNKDHNDSFEVLYGFIDGKKYSGAEVTELSKLPSQNEIRAQFIGLLQAPMSQTLSVMQGLLTSPIYCLQNKAKQAS